MGPLALCLWPEGHGPRGGKAAPMSAVSHPRLHAWLEVSWKRNALKVCPPLPSRDDDTERASVPGASAHNFYEDMMHTDALGSRPILAGGALVDSCSP